MKAPVDVVVRRRSRGGVIDIKPGDKCATRLPSITVIRIVLMVLVSPFSFTPVPI